VTTRKEDWPRLAAFVRDRRTDLGLTQEDVHAAGGPAPATMRLIEGALQLSYRPEILKRLEDALRWQRGSVRAVHEGREPVPLEDAAGGAPSAAVPAAPRPAPSPDQGVRAALYAALALVNAPLREVVLAEARNGLLADPVERAIWDAPGLSAGERAEEIANLRARRVSRRAVTG
jgi:hypothetical protein